MSQTAGLTSNLTLRVTAMGSPPILYQWRFNDADVPGATGSSLTVSNLHTAKEGSYQVLASNREGSVNSARAVVLLDSPLRIHDSATGSCRYNLRLSGPVGGTFIEFNDAGMTNTRSRFYRAASVP